jgi:hypothetical protein
MVSLIVLEFYAKYHLWEIAASVIYLAAYTGGCLVLTYFPDDLIKSHPMNIGLLSSSLGLFMMGPWDHEGEWFWLSLVGIAIVGFGVGLKYVPALPALLETSLFDLYYLNDEALADNLGGFLGIFVLFGHLLGHFVSFIIFDNEISTYSTIVFGLVSLGIFTAYGMFTNEFHLLAEGKFRDPDRDISKHTDDLAEKLL